MEFFCHTRAVSTWICWLGCEDGYVVVVVSAVIVAGLNQFYRYYLRRDSSDMADLVLYFHYCDRLDEFLSSFLDVIRMSMARVSVLTLLDP